MCLRIEILGCDPCNWWLVVCCSQRRSNLSACVITNNILWKEKADVLYNLE
jgi:hypothetical protein